MSVRKDKAGADMMMWKCRVGRSVIKEERRKRVRGVQSRVEVNLVFLCVSKARRGCDGKKKKRKERKEEKGWE